MNGKMLHLRVSKEVYKELEKIKKEEYFRSVQELIREVIREYIIERKREEAIKWLESKKGKIKVRRGNKKEREKLAKEYVQNL